MAASRRESSAGRARLAYDDRMDKFDGDVLSIGGTGAATSARRRPPMRIAQDISRQDSQVSGLLDEEVLEDVVSRRSASSICVRDSRQSSSASFSRCGAGIANEQSTMRVPLAGIDATVLAGSWRIWPMMRASSPPSVSWMALSGHVGEFG